MRESKKLMINSKERGGKRDKEEREGEEEKGIERKKGGREGGLDGHDGHPGFVFLNPSTEKCSQKTD